MADENTVEMVASDSVAVPESAPTVETAAAPAPKKRGRPAKVRTPEELEAAAAKKAAKPPREKKDPTTRRSNALAGAVTTAEFERVQAALHSPQGAAYGTVSQLVREAVLREVALLESLPAPEVAAAALRVDNR